jgi:hypothetical protein
MIDRDDKSTLVTRSSAASNRAPDSGSEPQLFVCWLSAAICEGIVLICKANVFYSIGRGSCLFSEKSSLLFRGPC